MVDTSFLHNDDGAHNSLHLQVSSIRRWIWFATWGWHRGFTLLLHVAQVRNTAILLQPRSRPSRAQFNCSLHSTCRGGCEGEAPLECDRFLQRHSPKYPLLASIALQLGGVVYSQKVAWILQVYGHAIHRGCQGEPCSNSQITDQRMAGQLFGYALGLTSVWILAFVLQELCSVIGRICKAPAG